MEPFVIKYFIVVFSLLFSTLPALAAPPNPHTFVPNRGVKPSKVMAVYMKGTITKGVHDVIYVWNRSYPVPVQQIGDLVRIFKYLSDSPVMPKQMLENEEFQLYRVLNTKKMIKALDRFQKDVDKAYRALFEYSSLVIGSKDGSMNKAYKALFRDMKRMVKSYNHLAEVTNREYRKKVMPYYKLNYKK